MPTRTLFTNFLSAVDSVSPFRTLRVKYNTKPGFDIDVLNAIQNRDKPYKKSSNQAWKLIRTILNMQTFHLKKLLIIRNNFTSRKKLHEIRATPKESGEL